MKGQVMGSVDTVDRRARPARWPRVLAALAAAAGSLLVAGAFSSPSASAEVGPGVTDNFWLATPSGPVEPYGVPDYGSPSGLLNQPVVGANTTNDQGGYWLVAGDGGIFNYGDAGFYGSAGSIHLNKPVVGIAATHDDRGYWMVATDGGIFSYGDAVFYGSTGGQPLNKPVVGMAVTPDGKGYWLVASDGGIFSYGDAGFYGSTGSIALNQPIVGMEPTPDGKGYWLVAADGGVFSFGDAQFFGSPAGATGEPVQKLVSTTDGNGYWVVEQNGTALAYGDAADQQIPPQILLLQPITPGDKAVLFAFQQLGKPYIWGGNGPVGYDCSGLALASWENGAGIGFARVSDDQYETAGVPVALSDLQAGDLVFWGDNQSDWTTVYHTAIYVGGDGIVEATGDVVQLNTIGQWGLDDLMPNGRRP
jgi:cell wall-associated NlpC family hydrolase